MNKIQPNKVGLVFGGMMAIWHAAWSLLVAMGLAKPLLDWIMSLHFLNFQYSLSPFSLSNALMLVVVTGVIGYVVGCVLGWLWNFMHRMSHA